MTEKVFVYDDFQPGKVLGANDIVLDGASLENWFALFPEDRQGNVMPPGMMASVIMQAYAQILPKRPPGGLHGSQSFSLQRLPVVGDVLTTQWSCVAKELKGERRWVTLDCETRTKGGDLLWTGRMLAAWGA